MEEVVKEHEQYVESVRDFNDWLTSAKEELQRWSDMSGDGASVQRKLSKVRVSIRGSLSPLAEIPTALTSTQRRFRSC